MSEITIAGRNVGPGNPCWIVAELGGNAAPDYATAERLMLAAKAVGADAVKTQMFEPADMTLKSDARPFRLIWQGKDMTLWDLYSKTAMPMNWHRGLNELAKKLGLIYFSSIFSKQGIGYAESVGIPCLKVASFELTDLPLIRAAARTGKPLILSTGMATRAEIREAIAVADGVGPPVSLVLLKCTSAYPAPLKEANLASLPSTRELDPWRTCPVGLSDHTRSNAVIAAAVTLGACVVERHLTLDRKKGGPDAAFSDEPHEFAAMVATIRDVESALGTVHYGPTESEIPMLRFRRSLWAVADIKAGEVLTAENVRCLRPADGLEPKEWDRVIGKRARVDIARATALKWEMMEA